MPATTTRTGADLEVGMTVLHPRDGRAVELFMELPDHGDDVRRFAVFGTRGGGDFLFVRPDERLDVVTH